MHVGSQGTLESFIVACKRVALFLNREPTVIIVDVGITASAIQLVLDGAHVGSLGAADCCESISIFDRTLLHLVKHVMLRVVHRARLGHSRHLVRYREASIVVAYVRVSAVAHQAVPLLVAPSMIKPSPFRYTIRLP